MLAQEIICHHELLIPLPHWKRYGTIVDRILELIQRLRTLAQAQRNDELSMTTHLICGYLSLIDTWDVNASSSLEARLSDIETCSLFYEVVFFASFRRYYTPSFRKLLILITALFNRLR